MDIFDVVSMQRLKDLAEKANTVGVLGRCSAVVTGEYKVSLMFELQSCFQAVLIGANDEVYDSSSNGKNGNGGHNPPSQPV